MKKWPGDFSEPNISGLLRSAFVNIERLENENMQLQRELFEIKQKVTIFIFGLPQQTEPINFGIHSTYNLKSDLTKFADELEKEKSND